MRSISFSVEAGGDVRAMLDYDSSKYAVAWFSSNPDIATVSSNGLIHGVSKGSTKITAYTNGKKYTCKVKVTETTPAIERTLHINVGGTKANKLKGLSNVSWKSGDSIKLEYSKLNQYPEYKSNKAEVAYIEPDGTLKAMKAGNAKLTTKINGKTVTITVNVS